MPVFNPDIARKYRDTPWWEVPNHLNFPGADESETEVVIQEVCGPQNRRLIITYGLPADPVFGDGLEVPAVFTNVFVSKHSYLVRVESDDAPPTEYYMDPSDLEPQQISNRVNPYPLTMAKASHSQNYIDSSRREFRQRISPIHKSTRDRPLTRNAGLEKQHRRMNVQRGHIIPPYLMQIGIVNPV